LAKAVFAAMDRPVKIEYIEMPESIRSQYQYFTEADTSKLRRAGCDRSPPSLEDGVEDYVRNYLAEGKYICPADLPAAVKRAVF
jgi:ADP-L-glycero-D-manno-heptose 6-epimerase